MNVGIITQARMGSARLPGKIMLDAGGKSLLAHHIERLRQSAVPIYVATTTVTADDRVVAFAQREGIQCFRGSEDDVLDRFYRCATANHLDVIIRVTSDCPLIDGKVIAEGLDRYRALYDERLYFSNTVTRTYPHGINFEIFSYTLLEDAHAHAIAPFDREHVTPYIIQNKSGNVRIEQLIRANDASRFRVTVDTQADYALVKKLIEDHNAATMDTDALVELLEAHPELVALNAGALPHAWGDTRP